jgi:hypothetical protein
MIYANIIRFFGSEKQTLGILSASNGRELFVCKTLELGDHDNVNKISCIPLGIYRCSYTRSNRLSTVAGRDVFTYEVMKVPGRAGIRIHSANFFSQLLGCIALGDAHKDINIDGNLDVIHSGVTLQKFVELMDKQDFMLTISKGNNS